MQLIPGYFSNYFRWIDKPLLIASSCVLAILIYFNYRYSIAVSVNASPFLIKFTGYLILFLCVFASTLLIAIPRAGSALPVDKNFYLLLFCSPAVFALKIALPAKAFVRELRLDPDMNRFIEVIAQWPLKAVPVFIFSTWLWKKSGNTRPVAGLATLSADRLKPYLILLLLMLPIVCFAATRPDFQHAYPKLSLVGDGGKLPGWKVVLFELLYGLDFFTIEFFFRGFLILAFARFAGRSVILPMAIFYCTIHFGKPLGECISSFFGGIILGVVVNHTRSIWGGLVVHLGIAWAMELAGVLI